MNKYNNKKVVVDGRKFDSKKEACEYLSLKKLEKEGYISDLQIQVPFVLAPPVVIDGRKKPALKYKADFVYMQNGQRIVKDVKGFITAVYRIKKHLMKSVHGIEILET